MKRICIMSFTLLFIWGHPVLPTGHSRMLQFGCFWCDCLTHLTILVDAGLQKVLTKLWNNLQEWKGSCAILNLTVSNPRVGEYFHQILNQSCWAILILRGYCRSPRLWLSETYRMGLILSKHEIQTCSNIKISLLLVGRVVYASIGSMPSSSTILVLKFVYMAAVTSFISVLRWGSFILLT